MSQETTSEESIAIAPELEKLKSVFKEETWTKSDPKSLGPGTFNELRTIIQSLQNKNLLSDASELIQSHLNEQPESLYGQFLNGLIGLKEAKPEAPNQFKRLIEYFRNMGKWSNVEYFSNLILEFTENRLAYRYLAKALENLGKPKNAMAAWETLARLDKDDAEIAQKVGESLIIEGNQIKGLYFIRQAFEATIRKKEFNKLDALWKTILEIAPEDSAYLEKMEKLLSEARNPEKIGQLLIPLLEHYNKQNREEMSIELMKKILTYTPLNYNIRKDLIAVYEKIYSEHSRLDDIIKISRLKDFKHPAGKAIEEFERHIALDTDNYVYHRSWGVGKIIDMENDALFIDFVEKKNHRMAIEMALPSLQPLSPEHIWVKKAETREELQELFDNDLINFFEVLFNSYNRVMSLADIKHEISPDFVPVKDWTKWWTKARNLLKKEPKFGISEKKRDEFFLRDKPITFSEDTRIQFNRAANFDKKISVAYDFINSANTDDLLDATHPQLIDYFLEHSREKEISSRVIAALFTLSDLLTIGNEESREAESHLEKVVRLSKNAPNLATVARGISNQEIKRKYLQLVQEERDDWADIFIEVLFETPIKIHKYIIAELSKREKYNHINTFIEQAVAGYKETPEIFLWVAKNLTQQIWNDSWLNYSFQDVLLYLMRLMLQLPRIETKGTKLKNSSIDILSNNNFQILRESLDQEPDRFNMKIFDLARGLSILTESMREEIQNLIRELRPDLKQSGTDVTEEETVDKESEENLIFVTQGSYDAKISLYNELVQNELPAISKEIGRAAEYGDLRENAEYKAALEKQATLKATAIKLKDDIDRARVVEADKIDIEKVGFGAKLKVENLSSNTEETIIILGPWDADHSKNIISYKAPLGRSFLGKKAGEEVSFQVGASEQKYKILSLEKAY